MLLSIRDRTSGWIAYVIVGLLVIPFALFGLYNYVGNGGPQVVATVGDAEITRTQLDQAYQQRQSELRRCWVISTIRRCSALTICVARSSSS